MAGYNRGIVATRKLNEKNKANLGRRGDTKIREVGGRRSHVNALEAYLIDVNGKAGEEYAKRVGAGTINPLTGMPEYHDWYDETLGEITHEHPKPGEEGNLGSDLPDPNAPDPYSYEGLSDVTGEQLKTFDPNLGADDVKYFQDIFTDVPFGFLGEEQDLTTRGLKSAYGATMGALGSREANLGLKMEGISRTAGRGLREAGRGRDIAASRSGLATSGTITQGYETQKKGLFQDYAAGIEGIQIGMGDIQREKGTALETLTLGKEGAGLDFRTAEYAEQQRQLDEYWDMIGLRQAAG